MSGGCSIEVIEAMKVQSDLKTVNLGIVGNNFESTFEEAPEPIRAKSPFYQRITKKDKNAMMR